MRDTATHSLLFVLAVVSGVHVGGEVFDSVVNDPVWSASIGAVSINGYVDRGWWASAG